MTTKERDQLLVVPLAGYEPTVARWLWLLTDIRARTLDVLAGMAECTLDWRPDEEANTIGTLLYHIVAIELDWLYVEILERPDYGPEVAALLPYEVREPSGRLTPIHGETLAEHLTRMAAARQLLLDTLRPMTAADFYRVRPLDAYDVTPEWVLYHLLEHETGHRGEIGELRRQAELTRDSEGKRSMTNRGPAFYDDDEVFATYAAMRQRPGNANDTLEKPVFDALLGDVSGLRVLDLGCGDAAFGRELLVKGAAAYVGIEGSAKMAAQAQQTLAGTTGEVIQRSMESWHYPTASFDCVTSRLAFHYIDDLAAIFAQIHGALVAGGRLIFSVEHPVITSCNQARPNGNGKRAGWLVDDYFVSGPRVVKWMNGEVVKMHRTLEEYFLLLQRAGFTVEALRESCPQREYFTDEAEYQRRQRIPLLLFLGGRKG